MYIRKFDIYIKFWIINFTNMPLPTGSYIQ